MEFTNFKMLVRDEIAKRAGENYKVRLNDVVKNNGVVLTGLTVMNEDSNISPTIYLNNYYEEYQNGNISLVSIVNDVMDNYNQNRIDKCIDMTKFLQYEYIKERIVYKLINTEKNKELLEDVPHMEFNDLSIVFECLVSEEKMGNATILIHNAHIKLWDKTVQDLYAQANINAPKIQPYDIKNMRDLICGMLCENERIDLEENVFGDNASECVRMYVLSNKSKIHGAACILYPELLKDLATAIGSGMYIIPSSIHEVILVPSVNCDDGESIRQMIREVNDTQVEIEEILSYSLYYYDKDEDKVLIA